MLTESEMMNTSTTPTPENEIDAPNESYYSDYVKAATVTASPPTPTPGLYTLTFPDTLQDSCFTSFDHGGRRYLRVLFRDQNLNEGVRITGGTHDGYEIKYFEVNNVPLAKFKEVEGKWLNEGDQNKDNLTDLLRTMGSEAEPRTLEEWKDAIITACQGQTTPTPIYLTWGARMKGNKTDAGWPKRIYAKQFKAADGSYSPFLEVVATHGFAQKSRKGEFLVAPGGSYRVYPNLVLSNGGAAQRM